VETGHVKQMGRGVQCVRTEIRLWRYRKCVGDKTGQCAKKKNQ
jgi:hypothetical protein